MYSLVMRMVFGPNFTAGSKSLLAPFTTVIIRYGGKAPGGGNLCVLFSSIVPKPRAYIAQSEHSVTFTERMHTETPARNEDKICTV